MRSGVDDMGKKKREEVRYLCPCCGNPAPFMRDNNKPVRCLYCKTLYKKNERVKE